MKNTSWLKVIPFNSINQLIFRGFITEAAPTATQAAYEKLAFIRVYWCGGEHWREVREKMLVPQMSSMVPNVSLFSSYSLAFLKDIKACHLLAKWKQRWNWIERLRVCIVLVNENTTRHWMRLIGSNTTPRSYWRCCNVSADLRFLKCRNADYPCSCWLR